MCTVTSESSTKDHESCKFSQIDESKCKQKCDEDELCRGYYMQTPQHCFLAKATKAGCGDGSRTQSGWNYKVGPLDDPKSSSCRSTSGRKCQIKQQGITEQYQSSPKLLFVEFYPRSSGILTT